jgi:hypothetical protein
MMPGTDGRHPFGEFGQPGYREQGMARKIVAEFEMRGIEGSSEFDAAEPSITGGHSWAFDGRHGHLKSARHSTAARELTLK